MKVYHITMTYPEREVGGVQSFVMNLHNSFSKRKIESKIISVSYEKGRANRVFRPFRVPILGEHPYRILFCLLTALSFLKKHGREDCLLHAHDTFFGGFTAALIKTILQKPLIVTDHGVQSVLLAFLYIERRGNTVLSRLNQTFLVLLEKFAATRADQILCVSQHSYNHFLRQGINSAKMKIVKNGIDVEKFKPKRPIFSNNEVQILYAGRLSEEKGINLLIEAFDLLRKEYENLELLIVGEGPYAASIKRMADKIDTRGIRFLPAKSANDMVDVYNDSDIVAVPSVLETGVPLVLLEAMACARIVITSHCGSLPEIVKNVGMVASFVNPSETIVQFKKILDDKEGATLLAKRARQKVIKDFNMTLCFNKILNTYIALHRGMPGRNDSRYKPAHARGFVFPFSEKSFS